MGYQTRRRMDRPLTMMEKQGSYRVTSAHGSVNIPAGKQGDRSGPGRKAKFVWLRPARLGDPYPYEGFLGVVLPKIGRLNRQSEAIFSRLGQGCPKKEGVYCAVPQLSKLAANRGLGVTVSFRWPSPLYVFSRV